MVLGVPCEHEEGAAVARLHEQREHRVDVARDARLVAIPVGERDHGVEGGDRATAEAFDSEIAQRRLDLCPKK